MTKKELITIIEYTSQDVFVSFEELCEICATSMDFVNELIAYEIIQPKRQASGKWVFDAAQLQRVKAAQRLQHDLDLNFVAIAIILDLLDEIDDLRARAELLERHILK